MKINALFVNGPWDGKMAPVETDRAVIRVPVPFKVDWANATVDHLMHTVDYTRRRFSADGEIRFVYALEGTTDLEVMDLLLAYYSTKVKVRT